MTILQSASKIVFIVLALTACGTFIYSVATGRTVMEVKEFMVLAAMAFSYYFAQKGSQDQRFGGK